MNTWTEEEEGGGGEATATKAGVDGSLVHQKEELSKSQDSKLQFKTVSLTRHSRAHSPSAWRASLVTRP
jgi:hypothetical protein